MLRDSHAYQWLRRRQLRVGRRFASTGLPLRTEQWAEYFALEIRLVVVGAVLCSCLFPTTSLVTSKGSLRLL